MTDPYGFKGFSRIISYCSNGPDFIVDMPYNSLNTLPLFCIFNVFQVLREQKGQSRLLKPSKLSSKIEGEIKCFHHLTKKKKGFYDY